MPEITNLKTISKGVTDIAKDAAYVAVGLGVLGYQRAQVQRVELSKKLSKDLALDGRLGDVRSNVSKGVRQLDGIVETAAQFVESTLQPIEEQLPASVTHLTTIAREQAREVRNQILAKLPA